MHDFILVSRKVIILSPYFKKGRVAKKISLYKIFVLVMPSLDSQIAP